MKPPNLLAAAMAAAALLVLPASPAEAQQRSVGGVKRSVPAGHHGGMHGRHGRHGKHGKHGFFFPFVFVERVPVVIEREVIREVPVIVEPPPPPPPPREPYVLGRSYASLPGGCMKLIEEGASYYLCSGEWYRQVGSGGAAKFKAVARP